MTLFLEEEGSVRLPFDVKETAELMIETVLEHEGCPYEAQVELLLTTDEEIHMMNREHRGIDRPTDVLSFPMLDVRTPGDLSGVEEMPDAFDPESGELMLGDIVISKDKVIAQAEEYGHSLKREYAFLIAHSMLHLLGYDHMEDDERLLMEQRQREIMEKAKIPR
ncbi:MAG TPA: rRNA maturation RNase YbeY [Candidatus Mediterraneibacter merdavium]|nr:rRNA maturation RNase YbeY [Candidatus Mediterraneibacter merdavium]